MEDPALQETTLEIIGTMDNLATIFPLKKAIILTGFFVSGNKGTQCNSVVNLISNKLGQYFPVTNSRLCFSS
jgi:hypothetical protein